MATLEKTCTTCGTPKLLTHFYKTPGGKHGVGSRCRPCTSAYGKARYTPEFRKAYTDYYKMLYRIDPEVRRAKAARARIYAASPEGKYHIAARAQARRIAASLKD